MLDQAQMEKILGTKDAPYILVSGSPTVPCAKCGHPTVAPGRVTVFDGMEMTTFCACITEEEKNEIAVRFNALLRMFYMKETPLQ